MIGWLAATAIGAWTVGLACMLWCDDIFGPDYPDPPTIRCSGPSGTLYTSSGSRTKRVRYDAEGDGDGVIVTQRVPNHLESLDEFPIGSYTIIFDAVDRYGRDEDCDISFSVAAHTCIYPSAPTDGSVACETPPNVDTIFGESCDFDCDTGYDLIGTSHQVCGNDEQWNHGGSVTCQIRSCDEPESPDNTEIGTCTELYNYNSVCTFTCLSGYRLVSEDRHNNVRCQASQIWEGTRQSCTDSVGPVIANCPDEQTTVYAESGEEFAIVTWEIPTATDNHDSFVSVVLESELGPGSMFNVHPTNVHSVVYGALDSSGNVALDCIFHIIVRQTMCPFIPHSFRLNRTCSDDYPLFGSNCTFECQQGYPLIGLNETHCERSQNELETGVWTHNETHPYCEIVPCPELNEPINGLLSCANWLNGLICTMACHEAWDIPRSAATNGRYVCGTSGIWIPPDPVPDCNRERDADHLTLPSEMFYFSGNCSSPETQEEIRQDFIGALNASAYSTECTNYPDCSAENVNVRCGNVGDFDRKRRDLSHWRTTRDTHTHEVQITFDFVLRGVSNSEMTPAQIDDATYNQFNDLEDFFTDYVENGGMVIPALTLQEDSLQFGRYDLLCELGTVGDFTTFTCKACPTGTYYNIEDNDCTNCPIGTYQDQDGAFNCIDCPDGNSTEVEGARSIAKCISKCTAGRFSSNGLVPCSFCPLHTYTDETMQIECHPCPHGSNTSNIGATSLLYCVTQIIPGGPCSAGPCSSNGVCAIRNGTYECHCADGYSGLNCEVPPNPCDEHSCQNRATCIPDGDQEDDYMCQCNSMHAGHFCQYQRVHGSWGHWSDWGTCSTTCADGQKMRARRCDNPTPNSYGDSCEGVANETRVCNLGECPACSELNRPYGVRTDCTQEANDVEECSVECRDGLMKQQEYPTSVRCGPETNYTWIPDVEISACGQARIPRHFQTVSRVEYDAPAGSIEENDAFRNSLVDMASRSAECISDESCTAVVDIASENNRKKRTTTQLIILVVEAELDDYDFMAGGVFDNATADAGIENVVRIVIQLETIAAAFNESIYNGSLVLTINGEDYSPDIDSIAFTGDIECEPGEAFYRLICANCPPGSYGDGLECTLCPIGEYQHIEGQEDCIACEDGLTTSSVASVNATACINSTGTDEISAESEEFSAESDDSYDQQKMYDAEIAIATSLSVVGLIVLSLAALVVYIKKKKRVEPTAPVAEVYEVPPPYKEVDNNPQNPALVDHTHSVKHQSLLPIDTVMQRTPKK